MLGLGFVRGALVNGTIDRYKATIEWNAVLPLIRQAFVLRIKRCCVYDQAWLVNAAELPIS
jgi:hypothetical protein